MTPPRQPIVRLLSPLALLLTGALALGCYKPNISEGGFRCNLDAGSNACPEGFKCDPLSQRCYKHLPDAAPVDKQETEAGPDVVCFDALTACTPGSGMCDPACQTGCDCGKKCSVNTMGALTCNPPRVQGYPKTVMKDCTIELDGSGGQTDNCAPGLVCIEDGCFPRCYQFCKSDGDCANSSCSRDVGGGQKVCDVPFVDTCNPLVGANPTGCAGGAMTCYLSSARPTHTICDCPQNGKLANEDCTRTRDCFPGLACVDRGTGASPKCLQVCRLTMGMDDCPAPATAGSCHPYTGLPPGATSHATYGYCY